MAQVITLAGERLFALKAQNNEQLDIDTFIFANVPGQDSSAPIDRNEGLPPIAQRVHSQIVQQVGRLNDNVVIYSTVLDSLTGPFDFNWVGLYSSVNQTLVAISHIPIVSKTVTVPGAAGNTLNRNFGIEYSGIAELAGISVAPETWQLDYTARLNGMDELTRKLAADMNGKDWFIDDGFKVVPRGTVNTFKVTTGVGYVSGLRVALEAEQVLTLSSYPQFVYVDAWFDGTSESVWTPKTAFTVTNGEMDDYIDVSGKAHYVVKIARINSADSVDDLRNVDGLPQQINGINSDLNLLKNREVYRCAQWENQIKKGHLPNIYCAGDSTMWGATVGNLGAQDPNNAPHSLGVALNLIFGVNINPVNIAISGSTLRGFISGTDGSGSTFEQKLKGFMADADIIYCNHGINDSQLDYAIERYRADLYEFVELCRKYNATPVLVTPNPNPILLIIDEAKSKRLLEFVKVMRETAIQLEVELVDQYYWFSQSSNKIKINEIVSDGAHLSTEAYRQAGFNLAIPLISAGTLFNEGDCVGLNQTTWFDNGTVSRQIQQRPDINGTRCGATLSFERNGSNYVGLNYPVILDAPQECISMIGLLWGSGARSTVTVNNQLISHKIHQEKYYGDVEFYNWDAEYKIRHKMWSGLNILGFLIDTIEVSNEDGFAFSGIYLPKIRFSTMCRKSTDISQQSIGIFDSVLANVKYTENDGIDFADLSGSKVLSIKKVEGVFTAYLYQFGAPIYSVVLNEIVQVDGDYPTEVRFEQTQVSILISNIALTIPLAVPMQDLKITTPWLTYFVEPVVNIF
ncbi:phage tail-collar fiber domain-containing protein [Shewanella baltica]|uniref:phage tail-collar fiber domain-containing protein n=1 Tax=Shewanella baltica TaxID=62322 RepID=UPI0021696046|nr:phage tail protein [Shewanella baltica]MCS6115232.1 hypothetical protein [Shewanella baltica]UVW63729.1 hypothetical protein HHE93_09065 [Shewanella baltica]